MDGHSGQDGDTEGESGHGERRMSRRSTETKVRFDPQIPGEPEEPAAAEGGAAEAASEDRPHPESESKEPAGAKRPSWPRFEAVVEEPEGEAEGKKETPTRASLTPSTAGEEAAAPSWETERKRSKEEEEEEEEEERVSEDSEGKDGEGRRAKSEGKQRLPSLSDAEDEAEWSEEVQRQQEQQLRRELMEQYHELTAERSRYQRYNMYLQQKINEAQRKKKGLEAAEAPEKGPEPEAPEKEQLYLRYLARLEELKQQETDDLEWYHQELGSLTQECQEKLARVEKEWRRFQALKKQVVMQVMGSGRMQGGRQAALQQVEQMQALEDKKEKEMSAVRLENVQLKQSLAHFETRLRAQEDATEGLLLIDFEQLKIENQTFSEKVEERNEELSKLRNKVTNNVQIITHVKEKLHFMDMENACKKAQLLEIEARVALGRDTLTKTKQARDSLRTDNVKLHQKCGLLGKEALLWDLEEKVDRTELLKRRLESLKRHHAGLTLSCKGVKQKIREAKAFLPS